MLAIKKYSKTAKTLNDIVPLTGGPPTAMLQKHQTTDLSLCTLIAVGLGGEMPCCWS